MASRAPPFRIRTSDFRIHTNISVDVQRAFAHRWLVDVGYLGRIYKNLWHNVDINAVDPNAKTPACSAGQPGCNVPTSGQTLAQAYVAVFNNGGSTPQPFFENARWIWRINLASA